MSTLTLKRLPSADWLAFGVALAAVFLKYLEPAVMSIIALVVFLPSILRETGVLHDIDEWTRGIMHRAGFHAAMAVVALLTVNYAAVQFGWFADTAHGHWPLEVQVFRLAAMWVFLVSYVIQYWGAREGVFRILVVAGVLNLAPVAVLLRPDNTMPAAAMSLAAAVACLLLVGLAFIVRRWPRAGAAVMAAVLLAGAALVFGVAAGTSTSRWSFAASVLQNAIVFGVTAIALFCENRNGEPA